MAETVDQAWKRIYGTPYTIENIACIHFANGFRAGRA